MPRAFDRAVDDRDILFEVHAVDHVCEGVGVDAHVRLIPVAELSCEGLPRAAHIDAKHVAQLAVGVLGEAEQLVPRMVTAQHDRCRTVAEIEQRLALRDLGRHDSAQRVRADDKCVIHRRVAVHHSRHDIAGQYPARAAVADLERIRGVAAQLAHDRGRRTPVPIVVIAAGDEDNQVDVFARETGLGHGVSCRRQPHR